MKITDNDISRYKTCQFDTCTVCNSITRGICNNIGYFYIFLPDVLSKYIDEFIKSTDINPDENVREAFDEWLEKRPIEGI